MDAEERGCVLSSLVGSFLVVASDVKEKQYEPSRRKAKPQQRSSVVVRL
jgi:hypothetical protein